MPLDGSVYCFVILEALTVTTVGLYVESAPAGHFRHYGDELLVRLRETGA